MRASAWSPWSVVIVIALTVSACHSSRGGANPEQAREFLRQALQAWQQQRSPDSLRQASPPVLMTEPKWAQGWKLLRFDFTHEGEARGHDWEVSVRLWLRGPDGNESQEQAAYVIATGSQVVIVRSEEP